MHNKSKPRVESLFIYLFFLLASLTVSCNPRLLRWSDFFINWTDTKGEVQQALQHQRSTTKRKTDYTLLCTRVITYKFICYSAASPIYPGCTGSELSSLNRLMAAGKQRPFELMNIWMLPTGRREKLLTRFSHVWLIYNKLHIHHKAQYVVHAS